MNTKNLTMGDIIEIEWFDTHSTDRLTHEELCGLCDVVLMMKNDMLLCPSTTPSLNAAFEATARLVSGAIDDILRMMRYLRQPENASRCEAQTSGNASQFVLETSTCGRGIYG